MHVWGLPMAPVHDPERICITRSDPELEQITGCPSDAPPAPFLTLPASCTRAAEDDDRGRLGRGTGRRQGSERPLPRRKRRTGRPRRLQPAAVRTLDLLPADHQPRRQPHGPRLQPAPGPGSRRSNPSPEKASRKRARPRSARSAPGTETERLRLPVAAKRRPDPRRRSEAVRGPGSRRRHRPAVRSHGDQRRAATATRSAPPAVI